MKLTINQALLGAVTFLMYLFGGYIPLLLMVGFIFVTNQSELCKRSAIKALVTAIIFSVILVLIGLLPDMVGVISSLGAVFGASLTAYGFLSFISFLTGCISIVKTVTFLFLAYSALHGKTFKVPFADSLIDRNTVQ